MFNPIKSPYLVSFDGKFSIKKADTEPPKDTPGKKELKARLEKAREEIAELQRVLYAHDHRSLLLVFQAMDAAGKDSTIRHVMKGTNPAGVRVRSFKAPSKNELEHDFLWRTAFRLPERGMIGIFNRSYYEEVLVVRVHPEYLKAQRLYSPKLKDIWKERFESIREHEKHLARNGTVVMKFFLNVSKQEQKNRFLRRLDLPEKNWKFNTADVKERGFWDDYMVAYEEALNATSRNYAPWYSIPADSKPYMRYVVAELVRKRLESMDLEWPKVDEREKERFNEMRELLENE